MNMSPETIDLLKSMRALLSDEKAWTKGTYVKDSVGMRVSWHSPWATCWCLEGAMYKFLDERNTTGHAILSVDAPTRRIWNDIVHAFPNKDLVHWNDAPERTHAEVMQALDTIIGDMPGRIRS